MRIAFICVLRLAIASASQESDCTTFCQTHTPPRCCNGQHSMNQMLSCYQKCMILSHQKASL